MASLRTRFFVNRIPSLSTAVQFRVLSTPQIRVPCINNRDFSTAASNGNLTMSSNGTEVGTAAAPAAATEKALPKLSPVEFRQYNRMADHMNYFHDNFRSTWNVLYTACETQKRPKGMSIKQFLSMGQQFCHHLTVHHTIEEQHIFPVLAKKMPAFRKELELLTQHKQIHNGLDKFEKYLEECADGERELRMGEMKEILDGFGKVLWQHLDDEVEQLGAENMRKYWTVEEIRRMPM